MKVRLYPSTLKVMQVVEDRIKAEENFLAINQAEQKAESAVYRPGHTEALAHTIRISENKIVALKQQYSLLVSHSPTEMMMEMDL